MTMLLHPQLNDFGCWVLGPGCCWSARIQGLVDIWEDVSRENRCLGFPSRSNRSSHISPGVTGPFRADFISLRPLGEQEI